MNADTRTRIAAALNTVAGLKGYRSKPGSSLKAGAAWPQWGGGTRDDESMGFNETWRVMIICDQGSADAADAFLDTHGEAVLAAIGSVLFVDSYAPALVDTEAGQLYALLIIGRSE